MYNFQAHIKRLKLAESLPIHECVNVNDKNFWIISTQENKFWVYCKQDLLGSGSYGNVYKCYPLSSGFSFSFQYTCFALKSANSRGLIEHEEVKLLSRHIKVYDWMLIGDDSYLIMEYFNKNDLAFGRRLSLPLRRALNYCMALCDQIHQMHNYSPMGNPIIHGDIKTGNIIIHKNDVFLVDFGLAIEVKGIPEGRDVTLAFFTQNIGGNPVYFAPETKEGKFGLITDVYMLTPVLATLLGATFPETDKITADRAGRDPYDVKFNFSGMTTFRAVGDLDLNVLLLAFLNKMSGYDYASRPNIEQILFFFTMLCKIVSSNYILDNIDVVKAKLLSCFLLPSNGLLCDGIMPQQLEFHHNIALKICRLQRIFLSGNSRFVKHLPAMLTGKDIDIWIQLLSFKSVDLSKIRTRHLSQVKKEMNFYKELTTLNIERDKVNAVFTNLAGESREHYSYIINYYKQNPIRPSYNALTTQSLILLSRCHKSILKYLSDHLKNEVVFSTETSDWIMFYQEWSSLKLVFSLPIFTSLTYSMIITVIKHVYTQTNRSLCQLLLEAFVQHSWAKLFDLKTLVDLQKKLLVFNNTDRWGPSVNTHSAQVTLYSKFETILFSTDRSNPWPNNPEDDFIDALFLSCQEWQAALQHRARVAFLLSLTKTLSKFYAEACQEYNNVLFIRFFTLLSNANILKSLNLQQTLELHNVSSLITARFSFLKTRDEPMAFLAQLNTHFVQLSSLHYRQRNKHYSNFKKTSMGHRIYFNKTFTGDEIVAHARQNPTSRTRQIIRPLLL